MAFDFPPAKDGRRVTNPETGVTYVYRDRYKSWIIESVDNKQLQIHIGENPPCNPNKGDLWFDPLTHCLYVWYENCWLSVADCFNGSCCYFKGEVDTRDDLPEYGSGVDPENPDNLLPKEPGDTWIILSTEELAIWSSQGWIYSGDNRYDDTAIWEALKQEIADREEGDKKLLQLIIALQDWTESEIEKLWEALKEEIKNREEADDELKCWIEKCCTESQESVEALWEALDQEIKDREDQGTELNALIAALDGRVTLLEAGLSLETSERIEADEALKAAIEQEISDREDADEVLYNLIADIESKYKGEVATIADLPKSRSNWKPVLGMFGGETVHAMHQANGLFMAGSDGGYLWTSRDGVNWQRRNLGQPFSGAVSSVLIDGGWHLAGGDGGMLSISADGETFEAVNSTTSSRITALTYSPKGTFYYATSDGVIASATDADGSGPRSWTKINISWAGKDASPITDLHWSVTSERLIATTMSGMVLVSENGVSWDLVDPAAGGALLSVVEWMGATYVGGPAAKQLLKSSDGLLWEEVPTTTLDGETISCLGVSATNTLMAGLTRSRFAILFDPTLDAWVKSNLGYGEEHTTHAVASAPHKVGFIPQAEGLDVAGGTDGRVSVLVPGGDMVPGDTWIVLDVGEIFTWSSNGWIHYPGEGGGGSGSIELGIQRIEAGEGILLDPVNGTGPLVKIAVDTELAFDDSELREDIDKNTEAIGKNATAIDEEAEARESADQALNQLIANETEDRELDQKRQDDEFKADQERQDKEIEELKDLLLSGCETPVLTDVLGGRDEPLYWGTRGAPDAFTWHLTVAVSLHQNAWPDPKKEAPTSIWVDEVEYPVLSVANASGTDWVYQLPDNSLDDLVGQEISVSLCEPGGPAFVTHEELEEDQRVQSAEFLIDQKRQDDELEEYKKEVQADQDRQDDELQALKDDINGCKTHTLDVVTGPELSYWGETMFRAPDQIALSEDFPLEVGSKFYLDDNLYQVDAVHETIDPPTPEVPTGDIYTWYELDEDFADDFDDFVNKTEIKFSQCTPKYVTKNEFEDDQERQDDEFAKDQKRQDDAFALDQKRQDDALADEIKARAERDLLHDAEIDTLEYKLETLVGVTFRGNYEFKHDKSCEEEYLECMANCTNDARCETDCLRAYSECEENSVEPGFFEAIDPNGQFDNLQEIIISKNDKSGVDIDWAGVLDKDDYLEVDHVFQGQLDKRNYGLYRIMEEPETHTNAKDEIVYVMKLQFLQGDGVLNEKELYEIRGITAAEGVNPEELGDFLTKEEANSLYSLKTHDHSEYRTSVDVASSAVTGAAGTAVKVENIGTTKDAVFKFTIPKGDTGRKGDKGDKGDVKMKTGEDTSPTLARGEMYWNHKNFTIYVGK